MFSVQYRIFDSKDRLVCKEKTCKTTKTLDKFIEKLQTRDNFHSIIAYSTTYVDVKFLDGDIGNLM